MTSSAWRWKRRAANGWSSTIPKTTRAKAPRARQAGGGGDERPGRATATAPTWEKSPKGDATDAPSTYNRQTTGIQRNYNGNTTELQREYNGTTTEQYESSWLVPGSFRAVFPPGPRPTFGDDSRVLSRAHRRGWVNTSSRKPSRSK